jgi:toxin YhaV
MEVNGWTLFQHTLFKAEYAKLLAEVEKLAQTQPETYQNHIRTKLLKRITDLISEEIPADPGHERFQQGKTLGAGHQHWKRAKFGKDHRYRLFFRYEQKKRGDQVIKVVIYAWMNNGKTLRKAGDKNDPYALFAKGLKKGQPPDSIEALLKESEELDVPLKEAKETESAE